MFLVKTSSVQLSKGSMVSFLDLGPKSVSPRRPCWAILNNGLDPGLIHRTDHGLDRGVDLGVNHGPWSGLWTEA